MTDLVTRTAAGGEFGDHVIGRDDELAAIGGFPDQTEACFGAIVLSSHTAEVEPAPPAGPWRMNRARDESEPS